MSLSVYVVQLRRMKNKKCSEGGELLFAKFSSTVAAYLNHIRT